MNKCDKNNFLNQMSYSLLFFMLLVGCQSVPPENSELNNEQRNKKISGVAQNKKSRSPKPLTKLPDAVKHELLKRETQKAKYTLLTEKRLDIAVNDLDAEQFFAAIVAGTPYSVAIHPNVKGKITLNLKDVTLDEAFTIIESMYGYHIDKLGKIIKVFPTGIRTETIALDYLFIKRQGNSSTNISSGGVSSSGSGNGSGSGSGTNNRNSGNSNNNSSQGGSSSGRSSGGNSGSGINVSTETESDAWGEFEKSLTSLLGNKPGRSIVISPQAGLVTVRALPAEINEVKDFIENIQKHLKRQVVIEAKIMEVTLNDDYQQGIEWSNVVNGAAQTNIESTEVRAGTTGNISGSAISGSIGGITSLAFLNADFTSVINLLSTQGNVQVLSSPRITATNNQKAVIKVGEDEYFVTDVQATTTTGTATTTIPDVSLTPFFSGIALDVTPQINESGEVILHVHPSVTLTAEQVKVISIGAQNYSLPLAQSSVRESDTIIKAQSGEIVVIGGLIETRKVDQVSKTPLLGDIPFLGELFKNKKQAEQKRELVIMLRPVVIDNSQVWKSQLEGARRLLKDWFPESSALDGNE